MDPITFFPEEVADIIFNLLPPKDLVTCSLVSSSWRDAANKNRLWRHHCRLDIDLESIPCRVQPQCMSDCEHLAPPCRYKKTYMQENHLRQNVIHNRFLALRRVECKTNDFLKNVVLVGGFVIKIEDNVISVLDTEKNMKQVDSTKCLLQGKRISFLKATENYIVLVQMDLLQVFSLCAGKLVLTMCKMVNEGEEFRLPMPDPRSSTYRHEVQQWHDEHNTNKNKCWNEYDTAGNYFVVLTSSEHSIDSFLHIWEIDNQCKVKTEIVSGVNAYSKVVNVYCNVGADYFYIILRCGVSVDWEWEDDNFETDSLRVITFRLNALETPAFSFNIIKYNAWCIAGRCIVILPSKEDDRRSYKIINVPNGVTSTKKISCKFDSCCSINSYKSLVAILCVRHIVVVDTDSLQETAVLTLDHNFRLILHFMSREFLVLEKGLNEFQIYDLKTCHKVGNIPQKGSIEISVLPIICFKSKKDYFTSDFKFIRYW